MSQTSKDMTSLKEGWDIVEEVTDYINAVCRLPGRGTAILISKPSATRGVLLTTSFAFQESAEAMNAHAVFMETPALGSQVKLGSNCGALNVALRPDIFFFCSAKPGREIYRPTIGIDPENDAPTATAAEEAETLGYAVVACSAGDSQRNSLQHVKPLSLPLILSKIPSINVGDKHLVITHPDAANRKFVVLEVAQVQPNHCVYTEADQTIHFASGGPIFTAGGEFVGIHHQSGEINLGIFISDVVKHLFESAMMAPCHIPLLDSNEEESTDEDPYNPNRPLSNDEHNQPLSILSRQRLMDVGAGDHLVDFKDLERLRESKKKPLKETLLPRRHLEVWKEWFTDYRSLILLLHAFPHHTKLLKLILVEMTSHSQRMNIQNVSRLGGIGILLEALDTHPYDPDLMTAGVTALGRISLYDENRDAIARCDGITAMCNILREYTKTETIQQWGTYCVLNLVHGTPRSPDSIAQFALHNGIQTLLQNLQNYSRHRYIVKWSAQTLGHVVAEDKAFFDIAIRNKVCTLLKDHVEHYKEDEFVIAALLFAVHQLTRFELYVPAADFFWKDGWIFKTVAHILEKHVKGNDPLVMEYAASIVQNILTFAPANTEAAIAADLERLLVESTTCWLSEPRLHVAVAAALTNMGVINVEEKYSHLQLGPSSALDD